MGQVEVAREDLAFIRDDGVKEYFPCCFDYTVKISFPIDILPRLPRIAARQLHQENAESDTFFNYFRNNMCLSFLNHLINGIDLRFNKYGKTALFTYALIPPEMRSSMTSSRYTGTTYQRLIIVKKSLFNGKEDGVLITFQKDRRQLCIRLNNVNSDAYPNLSVLLKIFETVTVTSCEC